MTDTTTAPHTYARVADLPAATRALAEGVVAVVNSASPGAEEAATVLAALLELPAPEPDTDGLLQCSRCDAWFWAEDGGEISSYTGPGTATRTVEVCAGCFEYDDPDIAGMYPGERLRADLELRDAMAAAS